MGSSDELVRNQGKSRVAGLVLAALVLVSMGLVNLPYQYTDPWGDWAGTLDLESAYSYRGQQNLPRVAGWPLNYWVQYERERIIENRFWSTSRLICNGFIAVVFSVMVYAYMQVRHRYIHQAQNQRLARAIFDIGIAVAILLVPGSLMAWEHRISSQHRHLSQRLGRSGNCYLACWLPKPIADHVPSRMMQSLARLREVSLYRPDQKTMELVTAVPTLATLNCYGGTFDSSAIEPLAGHVHLSALQLNRRLLSESDMDAVAALPWLTRLRLSRTNLNHQMLSRLDTLRLKSVDLTHTPLPLSELGTPGWSTSVQELRLSRQADGTEGSLDIDGWPQLRRLSVSRFSTRLNASPLRIRLANLPNLETLRLDRFQKHHLVLENLPRLTAIDEGLADLTSRYVYDDLYPGLTWLSALEVDGINSLNEIGCFARDLESLSIRHAPGLRSVALGSYLTTVLGGAIPQPASGDQCQAWIDHFGQREGPSTVDLTALPLAGSDLSPLVKNRRIRRLRFGETGVTFEQIQKLEGMEQLEKLDISSCRLVEDQLTWLLDRFPNLTDIVIDGSSLQRFDLTGKDQLKRIQTTPLDGVQHVHIVDLPSLQTYLRISQTPRQLEIRNAPSLRGLAVDAPWPSNARIEGLRDLEWFAGGGKTVGDDLVDELLKCQTLDQLTLAYTAVTRQKLIQIGQLEQLTLLSLPGTDVDDEVTSNWHRLESLWEINLDDTSVSTETLAWLSQIESLRQVSLNRVEFNQAAAEALAELKQVTELHLAGVSIESQMLRPLLQAGSLESLNLAGWSVDSELMKELAASNSLQHLMLRDSEIDGPSLTRLLVSNPKLFVEMGQLPSALSDEWVSDLRRRALEFERGISGWREALYPEGTPKLQAASEQENSDQENNRRVSRTTGTYRSGRINLQLFRPIPLAN